MNAKQTTPLLATLATVAPPLLIGGIVGLGLAWLFSGDDEKENTPETAPANAEAESRRKVAETTAFRQIPAEISVKPIAVPVSSAPRVTVPPPTVPNVPNIPSPAPVTAAIAIPKIVAQAPPPLIKKKFVTREDMATVFHHGARALTRTAAVAALKSLGFGKTAAYDALLEDGRFASWLQFAPDGIITWKS